LRPAAAGFRRPDRLTLAPYETAAVVSRDSPSYGREEGEFDRALGFVDATFALALTLLVTTLEVGVDPIAWASLSSLWDTVGHQFVAFLIAFIVISKYWLAHHRLVASFTGIDVPTIVVNLFMIGAVVLLPFTTESVGDPAVEDLPLPTAVLAINIAATTILFAAVYLVAARRGLLDPAPTPRERSAWLAQALLPAAIFLASVPIAYAISPAAAQLSWLLLLVLSTPVNAWASRHRRDRDGTAPSG